MVIQSWHQLSAHHCMNVKPFYMMSTVASEVVWSRKFMNIFGTTNRKIVQVPFYRLNLPDMYKNKMGRVDVGDQLRNSYRFDHWMRKRKWWWSFWMWYMGMLLTNSYLLYKKYCEVHSKSSIFTLWICLQCRKSMVKCKCTIYFILFFKLSLLNFILARRILFTSHVGGIHSQFKVCCWIQSH